MRQSVTILIFSILIIFVLNNANAETGSGGIIATTNKATFQPGDKVIITGSVAKIVTNNPVTIIVRNPIGNVYEVGQVNLSNNLFVHDFVLSDDVTAGIYNVQIKHGTQTGQLTFVVYGSQMQLIKVGDYNIKVRGNNTNLINYNDVSISTIDDSFTISVNASAISSGSVTQEFQIPKAIIDAPGGSLIVKIDGMILQCGQTETTTDRMLDCMIPSSAKELTIIGTTVIPEFGPIAVLILAVSIFSTIFLSNKMKIR
jgi:predicted secreted protein with PEFG-CTERM motif